MVLFTCLPPINVEFDRTLAIRVEIIASDDYVMPSFLEAGEVHT
jgi:hypothetical protein